MRKALIVDDSATVRSMVSKMARAWGLEPLQACNGKEALTALEANRDVCVALVDWNMPVMSGIEFVRHARKEEKYKQIKILMVTTETEMRQVIAAVEAGVDEYIMKPFTKEIFEDKLTMVGIARSDFESVK